MALRLSVVVAGSRPEGPPGSLFRVLHPLLHAGDAELVIATARPRSAPPAPNTRIVPCPPGTPVPALRLAGVRAAMAPLIALTEDFCAPIEGWAEALLEAQRGAARSAIAIGGPVARRGGTAADWALTLVEYGRFFRREPEGEVFDLPAINVAYAADGLREAIPRDANGFFEAHVHPRLRARGGRFWRVPRAVMFDENQRPLGGAVRSQYHHGRIFGSGRVENRGPGPRLLRAALAPVVPAVLLHRIVREAAAAGHRFEIVRALPAISLMLAAWSAGEAAGSLLGQGRSGTHWI